MPPVLSNTPPPPNPLHRPDGKFRSIEAARALAALVVVLMHAANLMRVDQFSGQVGLGNVFDFGYVGVDFFFVLSGFIITYVHFADLGQPDRLPRYLWRRFSRIFPIYWVILLLTIGVTTLGRLAMGKGFVLDMGLEDIPATVFLIIGDGPPQYVGVAWSLQFEVVFYAVFCLLLIHRGLGAAVFVVWFVALAAKVAGLVDLQLPLQLGHAHCLQFLLGVAVGAAARRWTLRAPPWALVVSVVAFSAAVVFEVYGPFGRFAAEGRVALGLASAAVLAALVGLENTRPLHTPDWLVRMGGVSYSIYLGHVLFINLTYLVLAKLGLYHALPEALVFTLGVAVALAATYQIGRRIELPLLGRLKDGIDLGRSTARPRVPGH